MFRLFRDCIARRGEPLPDSIAHTITAQNAVELNRILREDWGIPPQHVRFEHQNPGAIYVDFDRNRYAAAKDLYILVSDATVLAYLCGAGDGQQKSLMLHSFAVRVFRTDDLIARLDGGPRPREADLPDERVAGTDSMDEVVRKTLRVLSAVSV